MERKNPFENNPFLGRGISRQYYFDGAFAGASSKGCTGRDNCRKGSPSRGRDVGIPREEVRKGHCARQYAFSLRVLPLEKSQSRLLTIYLSCEVHFQDT